MKSKFQRYAYYYCILPNGNAPEFPALDAELRKRGVVAHRHNFGSGGAVYRIHRTELHKLPIDKDRNDEPYLGDDNSGHSIYHLNTAALASLLIAPYDKRYRDSEYDWRQI